MSDGQTYRYLHDEPLYPFGYGLSYSHFDYSNISVSPSVITAGQNVCVAVDVTNRGPYEADEVSFDTLFSTTTAMFVEHFTHFVNTTQYSTVFT